MQRFPEEGRSEDEVLRELEQRLERDHDYGDGGIIGSMISQPHPIVAEVFERYLPNNVGDPGLFPATAELEREAISRLADLLHVPVAGEGAGWLGSLVTGGNEANIVALWVARELRPSRRRLLIPESGHVSWDKAARLLGLELERVPLDASFALDADAIQQRLEALDDVCAIVGVAGSTPLGVVDPIGRLSELALEHDVYLHVDAAYGGFVLPFLEQLGQRVEPFDFRLPGVSSITVNPHKMGLAAQPAGGLVFRTRELAETLRFEIPYLAGGYSVQRTLTGTRSGAAVLAVWALFEHLGLAGYRALVAETMQRTHDLAERVRALRGIELLVEPTLNVLGIRPRCGDARALVEELRLLDWAVGEFPTHARVVLLPHVGDQDVDRFVADLGRVAAKFDTKSAAS